MSFLTSILNRLRCLVGRHDSYLAEKWYFRSMTVSIKPCKRCEKVTALVEPPKRKPFPDA